MEPLQGFWNVLIFLYNRPQSREKLVRSVRSLSSRFIGKSEDSVAVATRSNSSRDVHSGAKNKTVRRLSEHSSTDRTSSSHVVVETEPHVCRSVSVRFDTSNLPAHVEDQSSIAKEGGASFPIKEEGDEIDDENDVSP